MHGRFICEPIGDGKPTPTRKAKDVERVCCMCGAAFQTTTPTRRTCSKECQSKRQHEHAQTQARLRFPPPNICANCNKPILGKKDRQTYCSHACRVAHDKKTGKRNEITRKALANPKVQERMAKAREARSVREQARKEAIEARVAARRAERESRPKRALSMIGTRKCLQCAKEFEPEIGSRRRKFCSTECCRRYDKLKVGGNHRKRARHFGVSYEPINIDKVFERDGYRCQMCQTKTPKRLRGSFHDRAPELDHRIPMAMGGGHTYENVQCSCRKCNISKGHYRAAGQMSLFPNN